MHPRFAPEVPEFLHGAFSAYFRPLDRVAPSARNLRVSAYRNTQPKAGLLCCVGTTQPLPLNQHLNLELENEYRFGQRKLPFGQSIYGNITRRTITSCPNKC